MKISQRPLRLATTPPADEAAAPSRRQFCAHACQAASLVAVGAFLPGCGGGGSPTSPGSVPSGNTILPVVSGSVSGRTVTVPVGPGSALGTTGGTALVTAPLQPVNSFLVFRASSTSFTVLTAVCTHEGCIVEQFNGELFVCPCHNSKYTTAGAVANGPAAQPLRPFPSTVSGDVLTFTA